MRDDSANLSTNWAAFKNLFKGREVQIFLAALVIITLFNAFYIEIFPLFWLDESLFVDPAVNLARGNGLTTTMWGNTVYPNVWLYYPPGFVLLLGAWLKLFGISFEAVRSLNIVLAVITSLVVYITLVRARLVSTSVARIVCCLIPLLTYGACFSYHSGRPDVAGALIFALVALAATVESWDRKKWAMFAAGLPVAWFGIQDIVIVALLAGLFVLVYRDAFRSAVRLAMGVVTGLGLLLVFAAAIGGLRQILVFSLGSQMTVSGRLSQWILLHDNRGTHFLRNLGESIFVYLGNPSMACILITAIIVALLARRKPSGLDRRPLIVAGLLLTVLPVVVTLLGHFPIYYNLYTEIAGAAALFAFAANARHQGRNDIYWTTLAGSIAALVVGYPLILGTAIPDSGTRGYQEVRALVNRSIKPGEWVYVSQQAYMAVAEAGGVPVMTTYASGKLAVDMPADQKVRLNVAIIAPEDASLLHERLGKNWVNLPDDAVRPPPYQTLAERLHVPQQSGSAFAYDLRVYRRVPATAR